MAPCSQTGLNTAAASQLQMIKSSSSMQQPPPGTNLGCSACHSSRNYRSVLCSSAHTAACQLGMRTTIRGIQVRCLALQQVHG